MNNKRKWVMSLILIGCVLLLWSTVFLNYETMNASEILSPPNARHWFGTDDFGRDVFIRVIVGARYSIGASVLIVALSYLSGILIGGLAGIFGGWVDRIITNIVDILLAIPSLLIAITIAGVLGGGLRNGVIALVISYLPYYAKLTRGEIRKLKVREYVAVMYMQGAPLWYRMVTILKNIQLPLVTYMIVNISGTILSLATLSFLGIGVKVPQPEWGAMLNEGRLSFEQAPWLMIAPGLAITLTIIIFNGIHYWIQKKGRK
ncbi:ABC transporter permease [uncultured Granulicatella sp.]|uniref:ABC transporter permease n=1 Tax=uncultured Granulicatella sp. TaxID=316089 RepID=UPI0028EFC03C|nr:ABC transporter permease [uncultured Granulicatella sp.]